jgi:AhpD family alkylhydroperoxidase
MIGRIDYSEINPKAVNGLASIDKHLASLDERLRVLVQLRVSQINGCVYCVDLHSRQAREAGESQQRLDCLVAWQECPFFSQAERAAFAWAESLTHISTTHAPDELYQALRQYYSEQQVVDLTMVVALMNSWNRIAIGMRRLPERQEVVPGTGL